MIYFLPEWVKEYNEKKRKLRLRTLLIVFLISDILMAYVLFSFVKSENIINKKINAFFLSKQATNLNKSKKNDITYNTLKTTLSESLTSYDFEALNVNNNEIEITIKLQDTKELETLISKIEKSSSYKINSIVPSSDSEEFLKYKIGLEALK